MTGFITHLGLLFDEHANCSRCKFLRVCLHVLLVASIANVYLADVNYSCVCGYMVLLVAIASANIYVES